MIKIKQSTRERISNWIESNRKNVLLFGGGALIFRFSIASTYLSVLIMVISSMVLCLFTIPLEMMIDGIG